MASKLMKPMASVDTNSEFISTLIAADPRLLVDIDDTTRQRTKALLLKNAAELGATAPYLQLRSPAHILGACLKEFGEAIMLSEMGTFVDWVVSNSPDVPGFVSDCAAAPTIFGRIFAGYLERASSSQWATSNPFAQALPALDQPLGTILSDADAFKLVVAVVKGAEWNGFGPLEITNQQFSSLPTLRQKAKSYIASNSVDAAAILVACNVSANLATFVATYIP